MPLTLSRRNFVLATLAASGVAGSPAVALTEAGARDLVNRVVGELNAIIESGKSEAVILRDLENLFVRYADVNIMALYALGNDGRTASASQKQAFTEAFKGYISRKYGRRFRELPLGPRLDLSG